MVRLVFAVLLFPAAFLNGNEAGDLYLPADPLAGTTSFTQKGCEKCHAIEGRGGTFGPDLARSDLNASLLDIASLMWNHSPQMNRMMSDLRVIPPKVTGKELADLTAYLFFIDYFDKPGDMAEGRNVFRNKGCATCHRVGGVGNSVGPDLSLLKRYVSAIFLAQEMWNHGPRIKTRMDELGVNWPQFDGPEISHLMAFLRDASPDTTTERIFMRPGNPRVGEELFRRKKCTTCHLVHGVGTAIGPDLTQSTFHKSVTSVAAMMWNHGPVIWTKMAEKGVTSPTLTGNELADLIAYLYFLRYFEKTADLDRGELLFTQKGCQSCHHFGSQAVDGSITLSKIAPGSSAVDVSAMMWNHAYDMSAEMTRKKIKWPHFAEGELNDLVQYVLNRSER